MSKEVERPDVESLRQAADILLYGQWVPLPPDFLSVREIHRVLRDYLDLTATVGATGRYFLSQDVVSRELAENDVVTLIKESMRLYAGVLHYGLGVDIPSSVLKFLESTEVDDG